MFTPSSSQIEHADSLGLKLLPEPPFALPSDISSTIFEREYTIIDRTAKRDIEFRSGRLAAKFALSNFGDEREVGVASDRSPIWPSDFTGSISHSDAFVWSAVAKAGDIISLGIDTETIADETTLFQLKEEILLPSEQKLINALQVDNQTGFTLFFSAKESFYKCIYQVDPVFFGFHDVLVTSINSETLFLELTPESPHGPNRFPRIAVEYVVTDTNVFTACWLRA